MQIPGKNSVNLSKTGQMISLKSERKVKQSLKYQVLYLKLLTSFPENLRFFPLAKYLVSNDYQRIKVGDSDKKGTKLKSCITMCHRSLWEYIHSNKIQSVLHRH